MNFKIITMVISLAITTPCVSSEQQEKPNNHYTSDKITSMAVWEAQLESYGQNLNNWEHQRTQETKAAAPKKITLKQQLRQKIKK